MWTCPANVVSQCFHSAGLVLLLTLFRYTCIPKMQHFSGLTLLPSRVGCNNLIPVARKSSSWGNDPISSSLVDSAVRYKRSSLFSLQYTISAHSWKATTAEQDCCFTCRHLSLLQVSSRSYHERIRQSVFLSSSTYFIHSLTGNVSDSYVTTAISWTAK